LATPKTSSIQPASQSTPATSSSALTVPDESGARALIGQLAATPESDTARRVALTTSAIDALDQAWTRPPGADLDAGYFVRVGTVDRIIRGCDACERSLLEGVLVDEAARSHDAGALSNVNWSALMTQSDNAQPDDGGTATLIFDTLDPYGASLRYPLGYYLEAYRFYDRLPATMTASRTAWLGTLHVPSGPVKRAGPGRADAYLVASALASTVMDHTGIGGRPATAAEAWTVLDATHPGHGPNRRALLMRCWRVLVAPSNPAWVRLVGNPTANASTCGPVMDQGGVYHRFRATWLLSQYDLDGGIDSEPSAVYAELDGETNTASDTAGAPTTTREFDSPTHAIACEIVMPGAAGTIECHQRSAGVLLDPTGMALIACIMDCAPIRKHNAPALAYGSTITAGAFTCVSQRTGITCTVADRRGFQIGSGSVNPIQPPAPSTPPEPTVIRADGIAPTDFCLTDTLCLHAAIWDIRNPGEALALAYVDRCAPARHCAAWPLAIRFHRNDATLPCGTTAYTDAELGLHIFRSTLTTACAWNHTGP
jgi:hypothetical protein